MTDLSFENNVFIITGAGNGLGKSYALFLASRGAKIVVNDNGETKLLNGEYMKNADLVVDEIRNNGGVAIPNYLSCEFGEEIVKTAIENFGRIDVLINNAGVVDYHLFENMKKENWDKVMKVHLDGMFSCTKACWPYFINQKYGRIINTSSPFGLYGFIEQANYSTAKAGIYGFTKTIALEGVKYNILTNCISPIAYTNMTAEVKIKDFEKLFKVNYVTPVVAYLSHKECEENGSIYEVGGGYVCKVRFERSNGFFFGPDISLESFKDKIKQVGDFKNRKEFDENETFTSIVLKSYEKLYGKYNIEES